MWYMYDIGMDIYNIYLWYIYIYIYIYIFVIYIYIYIYISDHQMIIDYKCLA